MMKSHTKEADQVNKQLFRDDNPFYEKKDERASVVPMKVDPIAAPAKIDPTYEPNVPPRQPTIPAAPPISQIASSTARYDNN